MDKLDVEGKKVDNEPLVARNRVQDKDIDRSNVCEATNGTSYGRGNRRDLEINYCTEWSGDTGSRLDP
jgi:hypothetical protein